MKIKRFQMIIMIVLASTGGLWAGGQQDPGAVEAESETAVSFVTVTDLLGRQVTIEMPVERIAFTHYASSETLKILDVWDMVIARDGYTGDKMLYPNIDELPALGEMMDSPYTPNMELLLSLEPDLLILEVVPMTGIEELLKQVDGVIPVVVVKTYDPEDMFHSFEILGKLLDREVEAEAFTSWVDNVQQMLFEETGTLEDDGKTTMFYKTGYGNVNDLMTFSNDMSYVPTRDLMSGAVNIAADLPSQGGWVPSIDPEWLTQQDFEVLIIGDPQPGGYGTSLNDSSHLAVYRERVMNLPVFSGTKAVKSGRVYMLADVFFGTPRHIIGFSYLAKWMHPDLFEDINPAELHQEYFDKFLRTDADVINRGVFVYPAQ